MVIAADELVTSPVIVTFDRSFAASVLLVVGNVIVVESVPDSVSVLLTVTVLLSAIVKVAAVAGFVSVTLENTGSPDVTPTRGLSVDPTAIPFMSVPVVNTAT